MARKPLLAQLREVYRFAGIERRLMRAVRALELPRLTLGNLQHRYLQPQNLVLLKHISKGHWEVAGEGTG